MITNLFSDLTSWGPFRLALNLPLLPCPSLVEAFYREVLLTWADKNTYTCYLLLNPLTKKVMSWKASGYEGTNHELEMVYARIRSMEGVVEGICEAEMQRLLSELEHLQHPP